MFIGEVDCHSRALARGREQCRVVISDNHVVALCPEMWRPGSGVGGADEEEGPGRRAGERKGRWWETL